MVLVRVSVAGTTRADYGRSEVQPENAGGERREMLKSCV
jgi:hypothetical protein